MPSATVVGQALAFGIENDEASLVTQSVSVTRRKDKKEGKDKSGNVVSVAYYNPTSSVSVRGLGASAAVVGASLSLVTNYITGGATHVDQVAVNYGNEEFVESTVEATNYPNLN